MGCGPTVQPSSVLVKPGPASLSQAIGDRMQCRLSSGTVGNAAILSLHGGGYTHSLLETILKDGRFLSMVNTMLGDLQQKDMQTIGVKVASILTGTPDVPNMENLCNVFLVDDIVQAMIDPLGPDLREEFVPDFHGGGDDDRGVSYEPKWPGPSHRIAGMLSVPLRRETRHARDLEDVQGSYHSPWGLRGGRR